MSTHVYPCLLLSTNVCPYLSMSTHVYSSPQVPSAAPPYVCYVTLPGGSCFGSYGVRGILCEGSVGFLWEPRYFS